MEGDAEGEQGGHCASRLPAIAGRCLPPEYAPTRTDFTYGRDQPLRVQRLRFQPFFMTLISSATSSTSPTLRSYLARSRSSPPSAVPYWDLPDIALVSPTA